MTIFLDHQIQSLLDGSYKHELIQWHPKHNVLAVSFCNDSVGGEVHLFFEEGEHSKDIPLRSTPSKASCMSWHPEKKILGVGWSNGDLTIWNQGENAEPFRMNLSPKTELCHLAWSSNGFRLLIATASAEVFIYKIDHRGQPHSSPFSRNHLKESINSIVLKPPSLATSLQGPAKFSIASDLEAAADALDVFTVKRQPETHNQPVIGPSESATFFLGGNSGGVYCVRESGTVAESFSLDRPVIKLLYYARKNVLLTVSEDLMLCQHAVSSDCRTDEIIRVKLSGKPTKFKVVWATQGVLAMSSGENKLRLWDFENEENCILSLLPANGYSASDSILCLAYSENSGTLAAGTHLGQAAMWKFWKKDEDTEFQDQWKLQAPTSFQSPVQDIHWAENRKILAIATTKDVFTLLQHTMLSHMRDKLAAVQISQNALCLTRLEKLVTHEMKPEVRMKGIHVSERVVAVWDGQKVLIFEVDDTGNSVIVGNFQCNSSMVAICGQNVYVTEPGRIQVRTFQGTVKQLLPLAEEEGTPHQMDIFGETLVVGTSSGFIRIYDLSRREAKQKFHPKYVAEGIRDFASIVSVRVNPTGTKVSYVLRSTSGDTIPKLFIWDAEGDALSFFNCSSGLTDQMEYDISKEAKQSLNRHSVDMKGSVPDFHCWDSKDSRLLACQANGASEHNKHQQYIVSFFMTTDHGLLIQDSFIKSSLCENLLGIDMPYFYFTKRAEQDIENAKSEMEKAVTRQIIRRVSREFVGLENADEATREAMLNFSFFMTVGNMDEAFKAIKSIKSESVWENMAQMCVKTQRLDVAAVCLGNMGHARGARALRTVRRHEKEAEVHVGMLAVQLGLLDDASRLYNSCNRHDLLNKLNQTTNNWKQALDVAASNDRIHLRNTYYSYAAHLESVGALEGAVENYEKSDTHRFEVPRMLFDNPSILEQYVKQKNKDPYLNKWWAQYLESLGEMESARSYYTSAKDYLSVVRICCYLGNLEEASKVANESGDEASCYHLARQYENSDQFHEAVHFFMKAGAYSSAIHLAKEHGMEDKIAHLSLMSNESDMIEAAKFYEDKPGQADKAVMLYHKAGMFGRALDLAFRTEQFSALDLIAGDLDENSDPRVLERCAEFFAQNQQYTKAVQLLGYAKQYKKAIELCTGKNVPISEQLVELLTPSKEAIPNTVERNRLLEELADCCMHQGHYHYAAKKYTQAGSTIEAMRALLKSGDTEKIVFFANTARSKEIYVMAGNYLQTTNWKSDPEIMKQIVAFYTKGSAPQLLAGFYDACAQVEIDDYRDYEKALSALQEALRCVSKSEGKNALQTQEKADEISKKISLVRKFLNIKTIYQTDPVEAMKELQALANDPNIDESVRLGDIYAVLIIHNVKKENYKKAHSYLEELRKKLPKTDLSRFVKPQITDRIYQELKLPIPNLENGPIDDQDEDFVPESFSLKKQIDLNENDILNGHG